MTGDTAADPAAALLALMAAVEAAAESLRPLTGTVRLEVQLHAGYVHPQAELVYRSGKLIGWAIRRPDPRGETDPECETCHRSAGRLVARLLYLATHPGARMSAVDNPRRPPRPIRPNPPAS